MMISKQDTRMIKSSTDDAVQETLISEAMIDEEANMRRAKVKMEQVREENERLKLTLSRMMRDYHSLKMQFNGITQEDHESKKPTNLASMALAAASDDESDMVSLSLGRFSAKREEMINKNSNETNGIDLDLKLDLDNSAEDSRNLRADENSLDESKEEAGSNSSRRSPPKNSRIGDEDILQHPLKKPRVSVRTVCNTQTMHDGCQWRKYGQKIAKGNPCPRAYYRCTVSSSCPVRKQVQRCMDDMRILVTTYEGTHNHPLPPSATTMASATSAAVAMLSCGSSTSPPRHGPSASPSLFGFNFTSSNTNNIFPRATISTSQSHPTVILDLTAPNHTNKLFSSSALLSATHSTPTSLNFSSFDPKIGWETKFPAINNATSWPYSHPPLFSSIQKQAANDQKIAAATKAITHDPTFQSALAAAITSFVGNSSNVSSGMNFHLNFTQPASSSTSTNASIGCAASFMNRFPQPMISQEKSSSTLFAPLTILSASKSQAMSLADEGEQIKL